jgi:uncharacterized RDD family membrane protein YckC
MEIFDYNNQIIDKDSMGGDVHLVEASTGVRFANFIIDSIGRLAFIYGLGIIIGLIALSNEDLADYLVEVAIEEEETGYAMADIVFSFIAGLFYYLLFEYFTKGKTLGKILTRTRAVTEEGENLTFGQTLIRTLCRLIPFEPFSFFAASRGWHDTISRTMVIDERESKLPVQY